MIILTTENSIEVFVNSETTIQTNILGIPGADGSTNFIGLTDTPASFSGEATKHLAINAGETAVEFVAAPTATTEFVSLTDTPANYSGEANKLLSVNVGETAVEFITPPTSTTFAGLTDTPANYSGAGSQFLAVNVGATAVEFVAAPSGGGGQLFNWVINPDFTINQRSGTKTPGVGVYGYDRWKGHASGLEQVVEALPAGEYTLTWTGGGSGTFGGTTAVSPFTATVTAGNESVIVPSTSTLVSLVLGDETAADPFVGRHISQELAMCQRYYTKHDEYIYSGAFGNPPNNGILSWWFPVQMRSSTPTVSISNLNGTLVAEYFSNQSYTAQASLSQSWFNLGTADAEL